VSSYPVARRRLPCRPNEAGFTMVELIGALSIMGIAFLALAGAMGLGLRSVALGRQRQGATDIGGGRIEHARNIPYVNVALSTQPVHAATPGDPDWFVSGDNTSYDYSGNGTFEPLVVDISDGQILHHENPVAVGQTSLAVNQYVTWVDDPGLAGTHDYKRLSVVVQYNQPAVQGVSRLVRVSTFFTEGGVTVEGSDVDPAPGTTSSPTASPSPTATAGPCTGDTTAPAGSFSIDTGTAAEVGYSASNSVTLRFLSVSDPCSPIVITFSNDEIIYGAEVVYDAINPTISWSLTSGDGSKQVWGKIRDGKGNERVLGPESMTVDSIKPTVPGTLSRTLTCSGSDRTVNLAWGSSTDTNFRGYRVYKSINGGAYTALVTVSGTLRSDIDKKNYDSVRYYTVGYDKAGNESNATNVVSLAKNQCS
jgi:pilin/secretion family protein with methylation motif